MTDEEIVLSRVIQSMPVGYQINVCLERGRASVAAVGPNGWRLEPEANFPVFMAIGYLLACCCQHASSLGFWNPLDATDPRNVSKGVSLQCSE